MFGSPYSSSFPASSESSQELSWLSLDLLSSPSQHVEAGRCLNIALEKNDRPRGSGLR